MLEGDPDLVRVNALRAFAVALAVSADWRLGLTAQGPVPESVRERFASLGRRVLWRPG